MEMRSITIVETMMRGIENRVDRRRLIEY